MYNRGDVNYIVGIDILHKYSVYTTSITHLKLNNCWVDYCKHMKCLGWLNIDLGIATKISQVSKPI
jgi:hypothetical protein